MTDPTDNPENGTESGTGADEQTDAEQLADDGITHVALSFRPERWETHAGDDYAMQAGDPAEFIVPVEDVLGEDGDLIEPYTYEMDALKSHANAPSWVKCWSGPFEIHYDEYLTDPENAGEDVFETAVAVVTFHPQVPVDGRLVETDDTWTFTVPASDALTDDGDVVEDDTDASDALAHYQHAPELVRRWGELTKAWCFRITIDAFRIAGTELDPDAFVEKYVAGDGDE